MNRIKIISNIMKQKNHLQHVSKRPSSHYIGYREVSYDPNRPVQKKMAEFLGGIFWWWIGWHFITDWRHLIGEYILPNRSDWTDEELGIPAD